MDITYVKGLFLLFLIVSGNFIGNTLSCQIQELFTYSMAVKELLVFLLIFFTLNVVDNEKTSPINHLKVSVKIWLLYILLTKMDLKFSILVFTLLGSIYVINQHIEYKKRLDDITKEEEENYFKIMKIIEKIVIGLSIIGFVTYLMEKKKEYKNNFSIKKFLLGKRRCKSMDHFDLKH